MKMTASSMVREFSGGGGILSRARKSALNQDPHLHPLPDRERRQKGPVMTLAMAAVIVFMMLAVLMPIFQLNQLMQ
jgi:hypothetical protein